MAKKEVINNENLKVNNELLDKYRDVLEKYPDVINSRTVDTILKTGLELFDKIVGGIPIGTIISISSPPGVGKTTLLIQIAASLQNLGHSLVYFDTERSLSSRRIKDLGLDVNKILYLQPDSLEQVYEIMTQIILRKVEIKDENPIVFCWDSTSATPSIKEIETPEIEKTVGLKARLNSKYLKTINSILYKANCTLIYVNQLYTNIKMGFGTFGQPDEVVTGGRSLLYYPTIDIRLRDGNKSEGEKYDIDGKIVKLKAEKNRIKTPLKEFPMFLSYEKGFVNEYSIFYILKSLTKKEWKDMGFDDPILNTTGGWYVFKYKDFEIKFRAKEWDTLYLENEQLREYVSEIIDLWIEKVL